MPIGISDDHVELAAAFAKWAGSLGGIEAARAAEDDPAAEFAEQSRAVAEMGLAGIAVPEEQGGAGGSVADLAVALEAAASALVPGPLLGTAVASVVAGRPRRSGRVGGDAGRRWRWPVTGWSTTRPAPPTRWWSTVTTCAWSRSTASS